MENLEGAGRPNHYKEDCRNGASQQVALNH